MHFGTLIFPLSPTHTVTCYRYYEGEEGTK